MGYFDFPHTRTYDTDLGWLIKRVQSYDSTIETLDRWIEENQPKIDDFYNLSQMLQAGDIPPAVEAAIRQWLSTHGDIIADLLKNVWFGLTDAGYFVAYVPDSWSDITFKTTGLDILLDLMPEYGHLVLQY